MSGAAQALVRSLVAGGAIVLPDSGAWPAVKETLEWHRLAPWAWAGIDAARKRGQHLGRPRKLNGTQVEHAREMLDLGKSRNEVARILNVNPSTLYRRLHA